MTRHFAHALKNLAVGKFHIVHRNGGDRSALDRQRDHFGHGKQRQHTGHEADAIPQEQVVAGETRGTGLRVHADGGQHHAEQTDDHALENILAAREEGDEGNAENGEEEEFGRREGQHDRLQNRDHDREDDGTDDAANARGSDTGTQRPARLALLGHRIAVDRGGGIVAVAGHAEHDRGNLAGGAVDGVHGQEKDRALRHVHSEHEGDRQRD